MKFNPVAFDRHLKNIGQQIVWRKSYACACVNPASGNPDPKHALCSGNGRIWDDGVPSVVGIASQQTLAEWVQSGLYEAGDMVMSIPQASPMWDANQFDRIVMLNSTDGFSQPLVRGTPTERLIFTPASIGRVFWLNPTDRNQIVEGGIPVCDANGYLSWPNGGAPPMGASYSMTGEKVTEYFIFGQFPSDRNEHSGMRLPKRLVARKWDLFGRRGRITTA